MKKSIGLIILLLLSISVGAQEIKKDLKPFRSIIISTKIHVVMKKGDKESIRLVYSGVEESKINIQVSNKTLHLYLDNARVFEKNNPEDWTHNQYEMYHGANITAYITYTDIEYLEIRGDQHLVCKDPISTKEFILKAYGTNEIHLAYVNTGYMKASLYGENKLKIKEGKAKYQKYRLFGDNLVDTRGLRSAYATASIYGENQIKLNSKEALRVNSFGEGRIMYTGNPDVSKRIMIGESEVARID